MLINYKDELLHVLYEGYEMRTIEYGIGASK